MTAFQRLRDFNDKQVMLLSAGTDLDINNRENRIIWKYKYSFDDLPDDVVNIIMEYYHRAYFKSKIQFPIMLHNNFIIPRRCRGITNKGTQCQCRTKALTFISANEQFPLSIRDRAYIKAPNHALWNNPDQFCFAICLCKKHKKKYCEEGYELYTDDKLIEVGNVPKLIQDSGYNYRNGYLIKTK